MEKMKLDKGEIVTGIATVGIAAVLVIARIARSDAGSVESGRRNHLLEVARLGSALIADLGPLIEVLQALASRS